MSCARKRVGICDPLLSCLVIRPSFYTLDRSYARKCFTKALDSIRASGYEHAQASSVLYFLTSCGGFPVPGYSNNVINHKLLFLA